MCAKRQKWTVLNWTQLEHFAKEINSSNSAGFPLTLCAIQIYFVTQTNASSFVLYSACSATEMICTALTYCSSGHFVLDMCLQIWRVARFQGREAAVNAGCLRILCTSSFIMMIGMWKMPSRGSRRHTTRTTTTWLPTKNGNMPSVTICG